MYLLSLFEGFKAYVRILLKFHELKLVKSNDGLKSAQYVVVMIIKNDFGRMSFFFEYYRQMGFQSFIVIDNFSSDGTFEFCLDQPDTTVYRTSSSYRKSRYGNDWINFVLIRHCLGKWILYVDSDEFLVFPHNDTCSIADLTTFLSREKKSSFFSLMIDMYSDRNVDNNICPIGQNPITVCDYFDSTGYVKQYQSSTNTTWVKGGVRGRLFFKKNIANGPALNKTPLVFWRFPAVYLKSSHQLWPFKLNGPSGLQSGAITGALLHFKFLSTFTTKIEEEIVNSQHTTEYAAYGSQIREASPQFLFEDSRRYKDWKTLLDLGLIIDRSRKGNTRQLMSSSAKKVR